MGRACREQKSAEYSYSVLIPAGKYTSKNIHCIQGLLLSDLLRECWRCPECGCEDIFIDWDAAIAKCKTEDCCHYWSVRSGIGVDGAYKLT